MDVSEQIKKFHEIIETSYHDKLLERVRQGKNFMIIEFSDISKHDPDLADLLLENPDDLIKAFELAIEQFDLPAETKGFKIRINNLPESQIVLIRNIRSQHIGKLLTVEGIVRQKSDVRPQVTSAKFECPSCGNVISVLQLDQKFKEPSRCGCGRKGKFILLSKDLIDAQGIVLEEAPENLEGGEQPKRMNVFLKDDLVSPISEKRTNPGAKIIVVGKVKEIPIILHSGSQSVRYDLLVEANFVRAVEEDYYDILITPEEKEKIKDLAADRRVYEKMINSVAPSIYGHDKVKEAIVLQLVGGVKKVRGDGVITRGDMHVLLIGDPGAGKCSSGNTKIILGNGEITTIKSFYEKGVSFNGISNQGAMKIFSINENGLNQTSQPVRFWRRKTPKKMLKIITCTGNELIVTKDHPLFTTKDGFIFAKKAKEYQIGEYVATPSKINVEGAIQRIPTKIRLSKANNKIRYDIKKIFDQDFARLLGYLVGDRYTRFRKTTGIISFTNSNQELLDDFEKLIYNVFKLKVSKRKNQNSNSYEYYISSIELVRIIEKIDSNITKKSEGMCISKIVAKSPNYIIREFLKSLFDCEGHIREDRREIEFSSKSQELIFDIKYILLRFGIICQVSNGLKYASNTKDKTKRIYYRLRISGEDIIKFYEKIGFVSREKQKKLESWMYNSKRLNTNLNIIPNLNSLLRTLRKKYKLSQFSFPISRSTYQHYEKGDRYPSHNKLKQICKKYHEINAKDPLIDILNQIVNADIFWDKIKTIEKIKSAEDYVYDLEIEKVHNFVANGVVIHNSQLLKRAVIVAPKARYVSGKGASGAGLTAAVVKDEFLKGWSLEAGALVLANKGLCCIDEMDKMSVEDRSAMHEALEQQTITISKANIQATLRAETTVLAAANPKFGRFDPYDILAKQIDMPPALISRFDLIFPIKDLPDKDKDEKMAKHILNLHQAPEGQEPEIDTKLLKKFIAYVRQYSSPVLTDSAIDEIKTFYVEMRNSVADEAGFKSVPITARQLEALVRMAEANAKIRLSPKVTKKDAKRAIDILTFCLTQIGVDPETGKIDIDRISSGITSSQRNKIFIVKEIILELENKLGKTIPIEDIAKEGADKGVSESEIDEVIEKLKRSGDLFEPRRGFVSRI